MQSSIEKDFHHGLSTLEDLQQLGDPQLSPLIYRAIHHFSELKRNVDSQELKIYTAPRLHAFFKNFLVRNIKKLKNERVPKILLEADTAHFDVSLVDVMLEIFPHVIQGVAKIPFHGEMGVNLNENEIIFEGRALIDETLEQHRADLYALTRRLLKENILLTYKLKGLDESGLAHMSLHVNMAHDNKQIYGLDLTEPHGLVLGVSGIFPMFRTSVQELKQLGRHLCVEITSELKVEKYYRIPKHMLESSGEYEILHFAFLFRPLSIIIPKEGALYGAHLFGLNGGTGSDKTTNQQDVEREQRKSYRYIDFFSLLSC